MKDIDFKHFKNTNDTHYTEVGDFFSASKVMKYSKAFEGAFKLLFAGIITAWLFFDTGTPVSYLIAGLIGGGSVWYFIYITYKLMSSQLNNVKFHKLSIEEQCELANVAKIMNVTRCTEKQAKEKYISSNGYSVFDM